MSHATREAAMWWLGELMEACAASDGRDVPAIVRRHGERVSPVVLSFVARVAGLEGLGDSPSGPAVLRRLESDLAERFAPWKRADVPPEEVIRAARDFHVAPRVRLAPGALLDELFVDELLVARTGCPLKVAQAAITRDLASGLVECGVSERTCWPTMTGLEALAHRVEHVAGTER